jgi:hypothetical protein
MSPSTLVTAQELGNRDQINVGVAKFASPQVRKSAEAEKVMRIKPTRTFGIALAKTGARVLARRPSSAVTRSTETVAARD